MKDWTKFWIYLGLIIALLLYGLLLFRANTARARIDPNKLQINALYVPVIHVCTDYHSHCGKAFKQMLDLYGWKVCKLPVYSLFSGVPATCNDWYSDQELGHIFDTFPGFYDNG